jgi:ABC-type enterochelin transport system, periplasmic component
MRKTIIALITGAMVMSLAACTSGGNAATTAEMTEATSNVVTDDLEATEEIASEVTIVHTYGEVTVPTNPNSVIVFDYGLLDALGYVGVESVTGVPLGSNLPEHLKEFEGVTNVGSLKDADFEAISAIAPDLILITGRMAGSYDELSAIAPTVYMDMPGATYMETFRTNMEILSTIFVDQSDKFTTEIEDIQKRIDVIKEKSADVTALITQISDGGMSVFGFGSRYSIIYTDFGFKLTDETIEESSHGQASNYEYIVEQNPKYLFVVDRSAVVSSSDGSSTAEELLNNDLINEIDAAKEGNIVYLNSVNWYTVSGGIDSTSAMIAEVEAVLGIE